MKRRITFVDRIWVILSCILLFAANAPASSLTNISSQSTVVLGTNQSIEIYFGTWTYAANNPGVTPYPTSLEFQALGPSLSSALVAVPGSSQQYYSGFQVLASLQSLDGTVSIALDDPNADRLGLAAGSLLLTPGVYSGSGGSQAIAAISANIRLTPAQSQSIFGSLVSQGWAQSAKIVLLNQGPPLTLGLGGNYALSAAFAEPGLAGSGTATTSGITLSVDLYSPRLLAADTTLSTPEPAAAFLLVSGLAAILWVCLRQTKKVQAAVAQADSSER